MAYRADRYRDMLQRREKELKEDCECGCNPFSFALQKLWPLFENIAIGLLVGFIIGIGVILL